VRSDKNEEAEMIDYIGEITRLKKLSGAVIVAHNYQPSEIQDIADYTGDSLELSRISGKLSEKTILFCGVKFMAETAKIISPDKEVLLPDLEAGCSMADMVSASDIIDFKKDHPSCKVVCYVNSTAEVKTVSDLCVTSANAVDVIRKSGFEEILFVPDCNLGSFCEHQLNHIKFHLWPGYCCVHHLITLEHLEVARKKYPQAELLVHPECNLKVSLTADRALSTGQMLRYTAQSSQKEFIIGTETGILHKMRKDSPDKVFHPLSETMICKDMKKITLEKLYLALKERRYSIQLDTETVEKARTPIERMFALT